jgi:uncharacterized protein (TIGR02118 family)
MHKIMVFIGETTEPGPSGQAQWRARHVKTALALHGLRRMVRNDVQEAVRHDHAVASLQPVAFVEELWFDTEPVMDELDKLLRPTENLAVLQACSVREHVVFRRPVGDKQCLKRLSFLQRRAGMSPKEFSNYWQHVHAPLAHCHRHVALYVQNHAMPYPGALPLVFDGFAEFQITDLAAMQADYATEQGIAMRADVANFASTVSTYFVVAQEFPCALG